jgi:hypothetical protein
VLREDQVVLPGPVHLSIVKIALAPALIGVASWVSRRWGASAGGWFAALPLTSGPVVFVLAIERGPAFVEQTCVGTVLALISLTAFALAYNWSARRMSWPWCAAIGVTAYLACTWILQGVSLPLSLAFLVACASLLGASRIMPIDHERHHSIRVPWWDIPGRMLLAAAIVFLLTQSAEELGPRVSGLLTPFPVAATILAACTHHFEGRGAVGQLLRGLLIGLVSFASFFLILGLFIVQWGAGPAFGAATVGALVLHAGVLRHLGMGPRATFPLNGRSGVAA